MTEVREKHPSVASWMHPNRALDSDLGMCPDKESKLPPFGVQDEGPTNETTLAKSCLANFYLST